MMFLKEDFDFNKSIKPIQRKNPIQQWEELNNVQIKDVLMYQIGQNVFRPFQIQDTNNPWEAAPFTQTIRTSIQNPNTPAYRKIWDVLEKAGWKIVCNDAAKKLIDNTDSDLYRSLGIQASYIAEWSKQSLDHYGMFTGLIGISPDNGLYLVVLYHKSYRCFKVMFGYTGHVLYQDDASLIGSKEDIKNQQKVIKDILKIAKYYRASIQSKHFVYADLPGCPAAIKAPGKYSLQAYQNEGKARLYTSNGWCNNHAEMHIAWCPYWSDFKQELTPADYPDFIKNLPETSKIERALYSKVPTKVGKESYNKDLFSFLELTDSGTANWWICETGDYKWEGKGREAQRVPKN